MAGNDSFTFKHFTIWQQHCAMKVGTDGTLLGAWASAPVSGKILDVGTGTGLIALMLAQRFPGAFVTGIDIDIAAVEQAAANAAASPFGPRISILHKDVALMEGTFDAIVSNPPFFSQSLQCPDSRRTSARHDSTLTYRGLVFHSCRLLSDGGELSVIVPYDQRSRMDGEAALAGLFKSRECAVRTTPQKPPKRCLLAYRRHPVPLFRREELVIGSVAYRELTSEFYFFYPNV